MTYDQHRWLDERYLAESRMEADMAYQAIQAAEILGYDNVDAALFQGEQFGADLMNPANGTVPNLMHQADVMRGHYDRGRFTDRRNSTVGHGYFEAYARINGYTLEGAPGYDAWVPPRPTCFDDLPQPLENTSTAESSIPEEELQSGKSPQGDRYTRIIAKMQADKAAGITRDYGPWEEEPRTPEQELRSGNDFVFNLATVASQSYGGDIVDYLDHFDKGPEDAYVDRLIQIAIGRCGGSKEEYLDRFNRLAQLRADEAAKAARYAERSSNQHPLLRKLGNLLF